MIRLFVALSLLVPQIQSASATLLCTENAAFLKQRGFNITVTTSKNFRPRTNPEAEATAAKKRKLENCPKQTQATIYPAQLLKLFKELENANTAATQGTTVMLWDIDGNLVQPVFYMHNLAP